MQPAMWKPPVMLTQHQEHMVTKIRDGRKSRSVRVDMGPDVALTASMASAQRPVEEAAQQTEAPGPAGEE